MAPKLLMSRITFREEKCCRTVVDELPPYVLKRTQFTVNCKNINMQRFFVYKDS